MIYSYVVEVFYQLKKRNQGFPIAQIIGRTDFSLFPVAGYLVNGQPDMVPLIYFLFFYPFAQAHLGINDLIDVANDTVRGLKTIPVLYGLRRTGQWVLGFTAIHIISALLFATVLKPTALIGIALGLILLTFANIAVQRNPTPDSALKVLPMFHISMLIYTASIIISYFL